MQCRQRTFLDLAPLISNDKTPQHACSFPIYNNYSPYQLYSSLTMDWEFAPINKGVDINYAVHDNERKIY